MIQCELGCRKKPKINDDIIEETSTMISNKDLNTHFDIDCAEMTFSCKQCLNMFLRKDFQSHKCEARIKCQTCGQKVKEKYMEEHKEHECLNSLIKCNLQCGGIFLRKNMDSHVEDFCPNLIVECKNNCRKKLKRGREDLHITTYCINTKLKCPYADFGCSEKILRKSYGEHCIVNEEKHMSLICGKDSPGSARNYYDTAGKIYEMKRNQSNSKEVVKLLLKAAELGYASAQFKLSGIYFEGLIGIEIDFQNGMRWLMKAAENGLAEAQYRMGKLYHEGTRVEKDYSKAMEWYGKSAVQGNTQAKSNFIDILFIM